MKRQEMWDELLDGHIMAFIALIIELIELMLWKYMQTIFKDELMQSLVPIK